MCACARVCLQKEQVSQLRMGWLRVVEGGSGGEGVQSEWLKREAASPGLCLCGLSFSFCQTLTVISSVCSIRHAVLSVITINPAHRERAAAPTVLLSPDFCSPASFFLSLPCLFFPLFLFSLLPFLISSFRYPPFFPCFSFFFHCLHSFLVAFFPNAFIPPFFLLFHFPSLIKCFFPYLILSCFLLSFFPSFLPFSSCLSPLFLYFSSYFSSFFSFLLSFLTYFFPFLLIYFCLSVFHSFILSG